MNGLLLPHLSAADPDIVGEGSIDPLGLAVINDRLAEELIPALTARMSRLRFVTAIAACSLVCEPLEDIPPSDGVTPPYLAAEWHIVEGFARRLQGGETLQTPGIQKARAVLRQGGQLDRLSYLKAPKVFGFHGVYKRIARSFDLVDADLHPGPQAEELLRIWEREAALPGFVDVVPGTAGRRLLDRLRRATTDAVMNGRVSENPRSELWGKLLNAFRPDGAGRRERRLLWNWLSDPRAGVRSEIAGALKEIGAPDSEWELLRAIRRAASPALRVRIDAVESFERLAELLTVSFETVRYISTGQNWIREATLAKHPTIRACAVDVGEAFREAEDRAELLHPQIASLIELRLGDLAHAPNASIFAEMLLDHHEQIQREKGKRAWYERSSKGLAVRSRYSVGLPPAILGHYVHPYRVLALNSFVRDVA